LTQQKQLLQIMAHIVLIVSQDGIRNYITVQEAVDIVPLGNTR